MMVEQPAVMMPMAHNPMYVNIFTLTSFLMVVSIQTFARF
jgi:hypothetical protein